MGLFLMCLVEAAPRLHSARWPLPFTVLSFPPCPLDMNPMRQGLLSYLFIYYPVCYHPAHSRAPVSSCRWNEDTGPSMGKSPQIQPRWGGEKSP